MDKFDQLIEIAREIANEVNLKQNKNLKKFMDSVFEKVVEEFDLCKDFQARAKVYWDAFEAIFIVYNGNFFPWYQVNPSVWDSRNMYDRRR